METWPNQKEHVSTTVLVPTAVRTSLTMSQGFRVVNNGGAVELNSQTQFKTIGPNTGQLLFQLKCNSGTVHQPLGFLGQDSVPGNALQPRPVYTPHRHV